MQSDKEHLIPALSVDLIDELDRRYPMPSIEMLIEMHGTPELLGLLRQRQMVENLIAQRDFTEQDT